MSEYICLSCQRVVDPTDEPSTDEPSPGEPTTCADCWLQTERETEIQRAWFEDDDPEVGAA